MRRGQREVGPSTRLTAPSSVWPQCGVRIPQLKRVPKARGEGPRRLQVPGTCGWVGEILVTGYPTHINQRRRARPREQSRRCWTVPLRLNHPRTARIAPGRAPGNLEQFSGADFPPNNCASARPTTGHKATASHIVTPKSGACSGDAATWRYAPPKSDVNPESSSFGNCSGTLRPPATRVSTVAGR